MTERWYTPEKRRRGVRCYKRLQMNFEDIKQRWVPLESAPGVLCPVAPAGDVKVRVSESGKTKKGDKKYRVWVDDCQHLAIEKDGQIVVLVKCLECKKWRRL